MPRRCYIFDCDDSTGSFHRSPQNVFVRQEWIDVLAKADSKYGYLQKLPVFYLCSKHFENNCFSSTDHGRNILKNNAVPSLHLFEATSHRQKVIKLEIEILNTQDDCNTNIDTNNVEVASIQGIAEDTCLNECFVFERYENDNTRRLNIDDGLDKDYKDFLKNIDSSGIEFESDASNLLFEQPQIKNDVRKQHKLDLEILNHDKYGCTDEFSKVGHSNECLPNIEYLSTDKEEYMLWASTQCLKYANSDIMDNDFQSEFESCETVKITADNMLLQNDYKTLRYVGDISDSDFDNPNRAKQAFDLINRKYNEQIKKTRFYQQKYRLAQKKIDKLNNALPKYVKISKKTVKDDYITKLVDNEKSELEKQLFSNTKSGTTYTDEIKKFAITLQFYSTRAYEYVRSEFNNNLPHVGTIRSWLSAVNGNPGISQEALATIKVKVANAKKKSKVLVGCIIFDEMAIRKQVSLFNNKVCGYIDYGADFEKPEKHPIATEAQVVLFNCVTERWKIPVAYCFSASMNALEKIGVLREVLVCVRSTGVIVNSIVFDGHRINISMGYLLGAVFDEENMAPFFEEFQSNRKINIILDISHMIKLVRNTLESKRVLYNGSNGIIKWDYIVKLNDLQSSLGLHLGNKLRNAHVNFHKNKMKTRLAVQTLSLSVADAIQYLDNAGIQDFQGSSATVEFIQIFNNLFDIMNSKNKFGKNFKKPINKETAPEYFQYFYAAEIYIRELRMLDKDKKMVHVLDSPNKTGFLGFLIGMKSFKNMYYNDVASNNPIMEYISTYKYSQDHLEQFFSLIRARGGFNDNPTAVQFMVAFKRLLMKNSLKVTGSANCLPQDDTFLEPVDHSTESHKIWVSDDGIDDFNEEYLLEDLDCVTSDIVGYIAGFVENQIIKKIKCKLCIEAIYSGNVSSNSLIEQKMWGLLTIPQKNVVHICRTTEQIFKFYVHNMKEFNVLKVQNTVFYNILQTCPKIFDELASHKSIDGGLENHKYNLIKLIIISFLNIRAKYQCKIITDEQTLDNN